MIQEIFPCQFHNEFQIKTPKADSYFLYFQDGKLLLEHQTSKILPKFEVLNSLKEEAMTHCDYLFSIDQMDFFLVDETRVPIEESKTFGFYKTNIISNLEPMWMSFAAINAVQLHRFYQTSQFCGCCGSFMMKSKKERSMICSSCGHTIYPKIAPAVVVGILHEGKLLMAKYAGREYTRYALIAGYTEFGETLEETVNREVMEEVGLRVKNIRYYKNQPWAFSDSLLVGFWADLDGSPQVQLDKTELSTAEWLTPEDIPKGFTHISLTHEMILLFKNGKIK